MIYSMARQIIDSSIKRQKLEQAKNRRALTYKMLDYYNGDNTKQYIDGFFKAQSFREIPPTAMNITKRFINKMARTYTLGANRTLTSKQSQYDSLIRFKDVKLNFNKNIHKDDLKSGKQTKPNLHLINKKPHWKKFFDKLKKTTQNKEIHKCWAVKIDKKENNFYHKHINLLTSVFYLQNKNYYLGTHLKHNGSEIIVPGYENSILIFNGNILHDCVFPTNK